MASDIKNRNDGESIRNTKRAPKCRKGKEKETDNAEVDPQVKREKRKWIYIRKQKKEKRKKGKGKNKNEVKNKLSRQTNTRITKAISNYFSIVTLN